MFRPITIHATSLCLDLYESHKPQILRQTDIRSMHRDVASMICNRYGYLSNSRLVEFMADKLATDIVVLYYNFYHYNDCLQCNSLLNHINERVVSHIEEFHNQIADEDNSIN